MEQIKRLMLVLILAAIISTPLLYKGHGSSHQDVPVAFLPFTSAGVTVRLKGEVQSQGVYTFAKGLDAASVIKMTRQVSLEEIPVKVLLDPHLQHGDVVEISSAKFQLSEFTTKKMKARERMLLGLPLHPDQMDFDDWCCLPGIGPVLARRILDCRQINGDYQSVEAVRRVSGVGEKKFNMLRKYF
jgi:competence protein ComEA